MGYEGFAKFHRQIINWEWYSHPTVSRVFFHLMILANHSGKKWHGIPIERGQLLTSVDSIKKDLKLSTQQVRTALDKLKLTNEITSETTSNYHMITLNNYASYNKRKDEDNKEGNKDRNKPVTNEQQTNNKPTTTTKNVNNVDNEKKEDMGDAEMWLMKAFDFFWETYPARNNKKLEKGNTLKKYRTLSEDHRREIHRAVQIYANDIEILKGIGIRDPKRFLKDKYWQEYLTEPTCESHIDKDGNPILQHRAGDPPNTVRNSLGELKSSCAM